MQEGYKVNTTELPATGIPDQLVIDYDDILEQINADEVQYMLPVIVFYAVILTVGLFGNSLVLIVYTFRYKRSQARVFILFLAANDFLMCLIGLPYQVTDMTHPFTYTNSIMCKLLSFIMVALFHTSVFGLVVIAVDRYTKICHPLGTFHTQYFGKKRACVLAVILGLLLSWPILFLYGPSEMETGVYNITGHACFYEVADPESNIVLVYSMTTLCFCISCTICLIVLYSLVFCRIYSRYRKGVSLRSIQHHAEDSTCCESEVENRNSKSFLGAPTPRLSQNRKNSDQEAIFVVQTNGSSCTERQSTLDSKHGTLKDYSTGSESDVDDDCISKLIEEVENRTAELSHIDIKEDVKSTEANSDVLEKCLVSQCDTTNEISCEIMKEIQKEEKIELQETDANLDSASLTINKLNISNYKDNGIIFDEEVTNRLHQESESTNTDREKQHSVQNKDNSDRKDLNSKQSLDHQSDVKPETKRERSYSNIETSAISRDVRLSLPFSSIRPSASKASIGSRRKSVQFKVDGLRIHNSVYNNNQHCTNPPGQCPPRGHSKITKIMITITTLFILSYTPTLIIIIWSNMRPEIWDIISIHETLVFEFCLRFYLINNICNPFIYGFWDKRFKREVVLSFKHLVDILTSCGSN